jgi:proteasome lid subunit RPN8/RPN11
MEGSDDLVFALPDAKWSYVFSADAVAVMQGQAQRRWFRRESVGQLFADDLTTNIVNVVVATVLTPSRASRVGVTFNPDAAFRERETMLNSGLHCIGVWHTHPEVVPTPSGTDESLAKDHALAALSVLNGLTFVIVGTEAFPRGWYVGVHDGKEFHRAFVKNFDRSCVK